MVQVLSFEESGAVSFAAKLAMSDSFKSLFREGMTLVEDTAAYLDGNGREEAKNLPRLAALAFATESMRLTTRLMQIASWLLLQRAVNEGELSQDDASNEKRKVKLSEQQVATNAELFEQLPPRLIDIVDKSLRLQSRILHLDRAIYPANDEAGQPRRTAKALDQQRELLRAAFAVAEA